MPRRVAAMVDLYHSHEEDFGIKGKGYEQIATMFVDMEHAAARLVEAFDTEWGERRTAEMQPATSRDRDLGAKLLDTIDNLRAVHALVTGADTVVVSIDGREAEAVHEMFHCIADRITLIGRQVNKMRGEDAPAWKS